jgi:hypothetical protein
MAAGEAPSAASRQTQAVTAIARLAADGFIVAGDARWKTSRRWQQAMARAAVRLYDKGDPGDDLRVPIALALLDVYADTVDDEMLASLVEAMLPIESASLGLAL